ncbi:Esa1p-associated factor [Borealophlyctis nickersoniae]|nr:Esa1p-associated factor [Borealophlyctis nickersoniae]
MPPRNEPLAFAVEEKILCFHGPMLYEAKILKGEYWEGRDEAEDGPYYFVHYKGWKQTSVIRGIKSSLRKGAHTSANKIPPFMQNLKRQEELSAANSAQKTKGSAKKLAHDSGTDRSRKRPRESTADKEEDFLKRPEIRIAIPDSLKSQLVEDWENVTKNQKLVTLPRSPTVSEILDKFRTSVREGTRKKGAREKAGLEDTVNEVVDGLILYFDKALGNILLYRFERQQYVKIKNENPDKKMSDIYGAEHLLRLFVQLPTLIAHTNMDQDAVNILKDYFVQFLQYLEKNQKQLFLAEYENASPDYISVSKAT